MDEFADPCPDLRVCLPGGQPGLPGGYGVFMLGSALPVELSSAGIAAVLARPGVAESVSTAEDHPVHDAAGVAPADPDAGDEGDGQDREG